MLNFACLSLMPRSMCMHPALICSLIMQWPSLLGKSYKLVYYELTIFKKNNLISIRLIPSSIRLVPLSFFSHCNMTQVQFWCSLLALAGLLNAVAIPSHHEVHERRDALSQRWTKRDRVESHKLLPMRIGLAQSNLENGYEHLMDV